MITASSLKVFKKTSLIFFCFDYSIFVTRNPLDNRMWERMEDRIFTYKINVVLFFVASRGDQWVAGAGEGGGGAVHLK